MLLPSIANLENDSTAASDVLVIIARRTRSSNESSPLATFIINPYERASNKVPDRKFPCPNDGGDRNKKASFSSVSDGIRFNSISSLASPETPEGDVVKQAQRNDMMSINPPRLSRM